MQPDILFTSAARPWILGVFLAIGSVLLFVGGPDYYSSRSFKHFWDIGHIVYFMLFTGLLTRWRFVARMPLSGQWASMLLITLLSGALIEVLQHGTARTPDSWDVLRDVTGSLVALVFGYPGSGLRPAALRHSLRVAVLTLLLIQLWPVTRSLVDEAIARHQFPVLSDFETPFEIDRWTGNAGLSVLGMPSISRGKLLKLALTTDRYSGATLNHFDGDWRSFTTLNISLYNPDVKPLGITCRIHDVQHTDGNEEYADRFNRRFLLKQGWNQLEIDLHAVEESPAGRHMDMSRIRGLQLFVTALPAPRIIYLDNVALSS